MREKGSSGSCCLIPNNWTHVLDRAAFASLYHCSLTLVPTFFQDVSSPPLPPRCRGEGNVFQWLMRAISLSGRSEKQWLSEMLTHFNGNKYFVIKPIYQEKGDFQLISFNICIVVCHFIPYQLYWFWWWRGVSDNMWSLISSVNGSLGTLSLRQRWGLPF